jgi:hypothetical protein
LGSDPVGVAGQSGLDVSILKSAKASGDTHAKESIQHAKEAIKHAEESIQHAGKAT